MGVNKELEREIALLNTRIELLEKRLLSQQQELITQAVRAALAPRQEGLKREFSRRFNKNRPQLVKQRILERIKVSPITLADLKFSIVDQLGYCSKASFYRYFGELSGTVEERNKLLFIAQEMLNEGR